MNFDQFNEKSKIIINDAQNKAISLNNQQVTVVHLLFSIFNTEDEFIGEIIRTCNLKKSNILNHIELNLKKIARVSGTNINFFSNDLIKVLENSKEIKNDFNDSFVSPEIILYSILCEVNSDITNF